MSGKYRKQRRAKRYVPRQVRAPLMGRSCDRISMDMHTALAQLFVHPCPDARDTVADVFNVISFCIQGDRRFVEEQGVLEQAATVLNAYRAPAMLSDEDRHVLTHTASVIDTILGLLDKETLAESEHAYVAAAKAVRVQQPIGSGSRHGQ